MASTSLAIDWMMSSAQFNAEGLSDAFLITCRNFTYCSSAALIMTNVLPFSITLPNGSMSTWCIQVIVNKLHRKKVVGRWSAHLPTTYRPPTDHLPTTYRPPTDHFFTVQLVHDTCTVQNSICNFDNRPKSIHNKWLNYALSQLLLHVAGGLLTVYSCSTVLIAFQPLLSPKVSFWLNIRFLKAISVASNKRIA